MHLNRTRLAILGGVALGLVFAHPVGAQVTLLSDNFDSENGGTAALNYNNFANFSVFGGTVDLIGNGFADFYPGNGLYVDLDGTSAQAGTLQSKTDFNLTPGTYVLQFDLGGSQRGDTNQVDMSLGGVYSESFVRASSDPLAMVSRTFVVASDTTGFLSFHNLGGDDFGAILDNVSLTYQASAVPEPGTIALLTARMTGTGLLWRKRRAQPH